MRGGGYEEEPSRCMGAGNRDGRLGSAPTIRGAFVAKKEMTIEDGIEDVGPAW